MKQVIRFVVLLSFIALFLQTNAQNDSVKNTVVSLEYFAYAGGIIPHHDYMVYLTKNVYMANEFRLKFNTTGNEYWHKLYNYPTYGVGFYAGSYNNKTLGNPMAFFGFMELPFARKEKSYFSTIWSAGASFHFNEFDSISNPENIAIGSDLNVYIDFSFMYKRRLSDRVELGTGIKFQHFSNGATKFPNLGLNMASATVSVSYMPWSSLSNFKTAKGNAPEYKDYEVTIMTGAGRRAKNQENNDIKYLNTTLSVSVNKRVSVKRSFGIGFDYFYQSYLEKYYDNPEEVTNSDLMSYATFLSSDMIVKRFRMDVNLGFYLYRPVDFGQFFYERVALRYYVTKHLFANVSIKAHAVKAEYIEWGIGCTF